VFGKSIGGGARLIKKNLESLEIPQKAARPLLPLDALLAVLKTSSPRKPATGKLQQDIDISVSLLFLGFSFRRSHLRKEKPAIMRTCSHFSPGVKQFAR